ncbi:MAG: uncharacterized protein JWP87_1572 [Labilithrix sp.]|nr:uncharacterized protein [Labilithrix sp.]
MFVLALGAPVGCSERGIERREDVPRDEVATVATVSQPLVRGFGAGSLVVPMDTTYQNAGTLQAFGLVYALLRAGVPVHWAIKAGKAEGASDFTASATDRKTGAVVTNYAYRGGPFVIDAADRAAALPIVDAWLATKTTAVHDTTAAFNADIRKSLAAAPRIAVFVDGNEVIAFRYLNAAGIPDSTGKAWPAAKANAYPTYPDVLQPAAIRGPVVGGKPDGALLRSDGTPAYCQVTSMHYASPADEEVVREVRAWLDSGPLTHAFMECHATTTFENAANGRFLTTNGLVSEARPSPLTNRHPDSPFAQYDGTFTSVGGSVPAMGVPAGSALHATDTTLVNLSTAPVSSRIVWMTGFLDGNPAKGKVSYLGGHEYDTKVPISTNPEANGVRLFLDSLFESECASTNAQPSVSLVKSAPAAVNEATLTYTLAYANGGPGIADNAVISDPIPAGATFVSATGGGTLAGGVVTWNLGNLASGASGSVTLTVDLPANATYANQATLDYRVSLTPKQITSNGVTTTRTSTPIADLSLTVTDSPDPVASKGALAYTVNVSNGGPQAAPAVVVTLTLPAGATYASATGTGWTCTSAAGAVTCTNASVPVGAAPTLTIDVTAPPGPATATSTVSVSSSAADPAAANNSVTVTTVVGAGPGSDAGADGGPDGGVLDTDGDGIPDVVERRIGTDPLDADSDDDGVPDGAEPSFDQDTDGDGLINALDPDSDNDGLFDGTELGLDCSSKATNVLRGRCIPDGDKGATKTNPLDADTDKGGVKDGSEDANLNGVVDTGETDPTTGHGGDDATVVDSDKDGLGDLLEKSIGSDPNDADSDDDGVPDGAEPNPSDDTDGDGLKNVLDADSDDDGLYDGTEMGFGCGNPGTNAARNRCRADGDNGATKTSALLRDTDTGGASDGSEDANLDGVVDAGETDPTVGHQDDDDDVVDTDHDGLGDKLEATLGSNPNDADSDDDGLEDGAEPNPSIDQDGDGKTNILDADSDGDLLFDGTEAGRDCSDAATDKSKGTCRADADPSTTTAVLNPDTDNGGVKDGDEDTNHDGKLDPGERDPNDRADDVPGNGTSDAGPDAGSSGGTSGASGTSGTSGSLIDDGRLAGGGCACSAIPSSSSYPGGAGLAALAATVMALCGRRARRADRARSQQ